MESFSTNVQIVGKNLLRVVYKFFTVLCVKRSVKKTLCSKDFYKQFERHFYIKINTTMIPTNLVKILLLFLFGPFIETKKQESNFQQVSVFCFLFVARCALLQDMPNGIDFYKRIFLNVIPPCIIVSCYTLLLDFDNNQIDFSIQNLIFAI